MSLIEKLLQNPFRSLADAGAMSTLFATLAAIALVAAHASRLTKPAQETCAAISNPAPCGQPNDGPELCGWKGCCWDPSKGSNACFYPGGNAVPITHVHIVQSCHFDAGYANTTTNIMNLWFHTHFPQAVRELGGRVLRLFHHPLSLRCSTASALSSRARPGRCTSWRNLGSSPCSSIALLGFPDSSAHQRVKGPTSLTPSHGATSRGMRIPSMERSSCSSLPC